MPLTDLACRTTACPPDPRQHGSLLLQTLRRSQGRGAHETAHTLRKTAGQVLRPGQAHGRRARARSGWLASTCDPGLRRPTAYRPTAATEASPSGGKPL